MTTRAMGTAAGLLALTFVAFHLVQVASGAAGIAVTLGRTGRAQAAPREFGVRLWERYWDAALGVWLLALLVLFA